jgi:IS5 family transposase
MRPKERKDSAQKDLFRARLDQIVDMGRPLAKLAAAIDCGFLEQRLGAVYSDHSPPPTRLMAELAILKHMHDLSDEALCARWLENPYFQMFCGEEFLLHKLMFDRSTMTRWRQRMATTPSRRNKIDGRRPSMSSHPSGDQRTTVARPCQTKMARIS